MAAPTAHQRYPLTYFLCDALVKPAALQQVLQLPYAPKLRKARIIGYQRSNCGTESAVILDDENFGSLAPEQKVKGVAYKVGNEEVERRLHAHVGCHCRIQAVDIEVKSMWLGWSTVRGMAYLSRMNDEVQGARLASAILRPNSKPTFLRGGTKTHRTFNTIARRTSSTIAMRSRTRVTQSLSDHSEQCRYGVVADALASRWDRNASDISVDEMVRAPLVDTQANVGPPRKLRGPGKMRSTVLPNGESVFDFAFPAKRDGGV
ncbi:hypothetical protein NX059_006455 [Plenodomus lindquistii]|nr:hypothetical protein NX059_006455 [Plenodomus lindquistii]